MSQLARLPQIRLALLVWACALGLSGVRPALAQSAQQKDTAQQLEIERQRHNQEQETQQRKRQEPQAEAHLQGPAPAPGGQIPDHESPCFPIREIALAPAWASEFDWLLAHADGHSQQASADAVLGRCLGVQGIQIVMERLQNALIARGYVTTRVLAGPQNLQSGTLVLTLLPGRVGAIRPASQAEPPRGLWNTVPMASGDWLNLRDVEQALENFRRVPSVDADIQIAPGAEPGSSDLIFSLQQTRPWRVSLSADDSGTRSTGQYQGSLTFSYDNAAQLSDLFYITLLHDLGGAESGARGTRGHIVHYELPWGYWLIGGTVSSNRYYQTVAGASQDYLYSGTSRNVELRLSRLLHRDAASKTSLSLTGFQRVSHNYIDDTEIEVQRRVVGGIEWGLHHKRSGTDGRLEANLRYRVGTGAWGSLPAPEEAFGEGTSRMRLWFLEATAERPFALAGLPLNYSGSWRGQYNKTPLTPQDRLAIGGRFTVRGFDGLSVLSAERGWLLRNEVSTPLTPNVQGYLGLDTGHVAGPSAAQLVGQNLTGGVMGLRGQWAPVQLEVFVGQALRKPAHFKTAEPTLGFSLFMSL